MLKNQNNLDKIKHVVTIIEIPYTQNTQNKH